MEVQMEPFDSEDVKKKLEHLAGRELTIPPEQLNKLRFPVGAYDYSDGGASWQYLFLPGLSCVNARLLDASGASYSGPDGKRVVRLSDVVCLGDWRLLEEPVNVLATARSAKPFFATNMHSLISPSDPHHSDIEITFFVWDANGEAASNVSFDWRCRAVILAVIFAPIPSLPSPGTPTL
jgi:hypothetical protein